MSKNIMSVLMAFIIFLLEIIFLFLGILEDLNYYWGFGIISFLSLIWGTIVLCYGVYFKNSESTYVTAGFTLQVPLLSIVSGYFIYRINKNRVGKYGI